MRHVYTPCGLDRLDRRIAEARAAYREVCDDNPAAAESGDSSVWHDNFAFEENQRQMHRLAARVRELERIREQAEVAPHLADAPEQACLGASVRYLDDGVERWCWLAGFDDGDPLAGRVSYNSPLGEALLGARPGDLRTLRGPRGSREIEVVELGPSPPSAGPHR